LSKRYVSEEDLRANYLLPRLQEASRLIGVSDIVDFHLGERVNGTADITAEKSGKRVLVIEAKFKKKTGRIERDIEPRDPDVVNQAINYAVFGGFPYYATCNSKRLILFQLKPGVRAYESEIASFEYERTSDWAESLLKTVLELIPVRLKPLDDTLVDTLQEAFNDLYPEFLKSLRDRLQENKFNESYTDWLKSQGIEPNDENNRLIAEQTTYLQINKLLFYEVIRTIYPDKLRPLKIPEDEDVSDALSKFYEDARAIDYAPIYQGDIISEIPFTRRAEERIRTLMDTLGEFDFSKMESDFLGRIYEKLIPPLDRKRLGQFYTPQGIVDFIVELTITKPSSVVLDPGCGSGSFLVKAYHKLRELNGIPRRVDGPLSESFHKQLLECIYGIDINQFPAHLSVINLATQNARARVDRVNVVVSDFFDIRPGQATLMGFESLTTEGKRTLVKLPPAFDTVVANPPYIRQELLGVKEKQKIKELIEDEFRNKLFIGAPPKKVKNAVVLDKQSDIYIYFFIHGLRLLRNNGFLGFISSNKWLEVGYGEPFQQFLLNYTKIHYIVEFDRAIFPDAEVNTDITILEKESKKEKRDSNFVRFVRMKKKLDMETLLQLINEVEESYEDDSIRINIVKQSQLVSGKWNVYLRAPPVLRHIVEHHKVKPLSELAEVLRAPTTGHNDYFILSNDKVKEWKIEKRYLKPCLLSPKKIRGLIVENVEDFMFIASKSKQELQKTNALKYIEFGEKLEVEVTRGSKKGKRRLPEIETLANRKPYWYALPEHNVSPILFPRLTDVRPVFLKNNAGVHTPHVFYYIYPKEKSDADVLLAYLNSSVNAFLVELYGRSYGGGVLELLIYEIQNLPTLDPRQVSQKEKNQLIAKFYALVEAIKFRNQAEDEFEKVKSKDRKSIGLFEIEARKGLEEALDNEKKAREQLDEAVYDALGLTSDERRQVQIGLKELQEIRRLRTQV
jgi:type I restriction-modification system DNA methylase subunit